MTTQSVAVEIPVRSDYGAVELKEFIRKYTVRGFLVTLGLLILFLILYFTMAKIQASANDKPLMAPVVVTTLQDLTEETNAENVPPPETIISTGPQFRAGTPVPVPDAQITPDMQDIAPMDVQARASAEGGTGEVDLGGFAQVNVDNERVVNIQEKEPEPDEFIPVEKEPAVDLEKIQKKIVYPELARRAGVEGKVIVRVLVQKNGKIGKMLVEYSDNELLNEAATKAIRETSYIPPAIQNQQPIACWVSIPIQFKLR